MAFSAAAVLTASAAIGATLQSVQTYTAAQADAYRVDFSTFLNAAPNQQIALEDFEDLTPQGSNTMIEREVGSSLSTSVGEFSVALDDANASGTGTGGTVTNSTLNGVTNTGTELALRNGSVFGRTSLWDNDYTLGNNDSGEWFLDSNDTFGIKWDVDVGTEFDRIAFSIMDGSDAGAFLKVLVGDDVLYDQRLEEGPGQLADGNIAFVVIDFVGSVTGATIELTNFASGNGTDLKRNDGVSIDGAYVGVVPLPASLAFMLVGVGALGLARKRKV
ncbi:MAG: VPLPA-CTERM sorting domain-containing protein [Pseudomonadota bacterium]